MVSFKLYRINWKLSKNWKINFEMRRQRPTSSFTSFFRPCLFWLSFCLYHFGTLFWSIDNFRSWTKSWNKVTIQTNVKYVFNHSMEAIVDQQKSTAITSTSVSHVWLQSLMDVEDARFVTTDSAKRIFLHCTWASLELKYRMLPKFRDYQELSSNWRKPSPSWSGCVFRKFLEHLPPHT